MHKSPRPPRNRATHRFRYREQYGVIVLCSNESHQRKIYTRLRRAGLECKVVVT